MKKTCVQCNRVFYTSFQTEVFCTQFCGYRYGTKSFYAFLRKAKEDLDNG